CTRRRRAAGRGSRSLSDEQPYVEVSIQDVDEASRRLELRAFPDRNGDQHLVPAEKRADVRAGVDRLVASCERVWSLRAELERPADQGQLRRRVIEQAPAEVPVDRPPVVRVDEAEVRELVALVEVGHARAGELEQRLCEGDPLAELRDALDERLERPQKVGVPVQRAGEPLHRLLPADVRVEPVRVRLRLAKRLLEVSVETP